MAVNISYPGRPQGVDARGLALGLAELGGIVDERRGRAAFGDYLDTLYSGSQQQPMSLAALDPQPTQSVQPMDPASRRPAEAHAASGGTPPQGAIEAYIRHAAQKRGIDPDTAVRVAMSEGGVTDPTRQSDVVKDGVREQSFGPFQLYMGGGLGNEFQQATGLHPGDSSAWQKAIDFALDKAKEGGWGPWYGAAKAGIGDMEGIGGAQSATGAPVSQGVQMAQSTPAASPASLLPPPDVMRALFRSESTRPLAIQLAQSAQQARQGDPEAALKLEKLRLEIEQMRSGEGTEYGLSPVYGRDASGNLVLGQLSKNGRFRQTELPEGFDLQPGVDRIDLGTAWGIVNRAGEVVDTIPKDLAGAERQKEVGTAQGKAEAAAAGDMQAAQNALDLIDSLRNDPNRQRGTGFSATFNAMPGTRGYDFQTKVEQAKSGAFLSAIQQLRGMGALSNAEGQTATAAVTRLNTATSEEEFMAALDDYEKIVRQGYEKAAARAGQAAPTGNRTSSGVEWSLDD